VVLTVPDFDAAVAFYRDALGLKQVADWSSEEGRVVLLEGGRATLELFDERQAETVDRIEAGRRVSGTGPARVRGRRQRGHRCPARRSRAPRRIAAATMTPWGDRNARVRAPDGMQLTLFTPG
jgi:methylmalonyl-CoA/ethylmalonyl-CoA epimerase